MGRVGLCTAESYIGGEFFEPNYLDTRDDLFARVFPHMDAPVGGVGFARIAQAATDWHERARSVATDGQVPLLGLFKERSDGAGHSFGVASVRGFGGMTEERPAFERSGDSDALRLLTLRQLDDSFGISDTAYRNTGYDRLSDAEIDAHRITRATSRSCRRRTTSAPVAPRPSATCSPCRPTSPVSTRPRTSRASSAASRPPGTRASRCADCPARAVVGGRPAGRHDPLHPAAHLDRTHGARCHRALADGLALLHPGLVDVDVVADDRVTLRATGAAAELLALLQQAPASVDVAEVQPAHEITRTLASGAMSHGASSPPRTRPSRTARTWSAACRTRARAASTTLPLRHDPRLAHQAVRLGPVRHLGGLPRRPDARGARDQDRPGREARRGRSAAGSEGHGGHRRGPRWHPGVELISPPPHHDTYSIEDLAQLIHDCKAARVRVVVKLVSSEGIGTIAVGVAKAGADVINVAGNTGGTGAAAVTSLKYAGRSAEIGVAEVHQALVANGLRQKVTLRCSGAHQTGSDVVTSALLGGDSFEFGTTALMMLGCVMAKKLQREVPGGPDHERRGLRGRPPRARAVPAQHRPRRPADPRPPRPALAPRGPGRTDLLQLLDHPASVGRLDVRNLLAQVPEKVVTDPEYLEKDFRTDDALIEQVRAALVDGHQHALTVDGIALGNADKSVGGQFGIDVERVLNHELRGVDLSRTPRSPRTTVAVVAWSTVP